MLGGRSADLLGRRRVFLVGTALFALASLGCALADSRGLLIAARAVQGLSGAVLSPATLSIITSSFAEGRERNRGSGRVGRGRRPRRLLGRPARRDPDPDVRVAGDLRRQRAARARSSSSLGLRVIPASAPAEGTRHFDLTGAVLVTAGLVSFTFGIVRTDTLGWGALGRARTADRRGRAAGGVPARRGAVRARAAGAAVDLPDRTAARGQRGRAAPVRVAVPGLVLPDAVPAAGAPLRRDRGRTRVPADDAVDLRGVDAGAAGGRSLRAHGG